MVTCYLAEACLAIRAQRNTCVERSVTGYVIDQLDGYVMLGYVMYYVERDMLYIEREN